MPRKTRKQKKLAQLHRTSALDKAIMAPVEKKTAAEPINKPINITDRDKQFRFVVIKDLTKTVILALLLFALEFLVFYANLRDVTHKLPILRL